MKKILIGTATYNEAKNISSFIVKIKKLKLNLDILVIEDFILNKNQQNKLLIKNYKNKFELD